MTTVALPRSVFDSGVPAWTAAPVLLEEVRRRTEVEWHACCVIQRAWRSNVARFEKRWRALRQAYRERQYRRDAAAVTVQMFLRRCAVRARIAERWADGTVALDLSDVLGGSVQSSQALTTSLSFSAVPRVALSPALHAAGRQSEDLLKHRSGAAALQIQTAYRAYNARFEASWRRERRDTRRARLCVEEDHATSTKAALVLQKVFRACGERIGSQRNRLCNLLEAASVSRKAAIIRNAVTRIQALWRGYRARIYVRYERRQRHKQLKKRGSKRSRMIEASEIAAQVCGIGTLAAISARYKARRLAAVCIQTAWRSNRARKQVEWLRQRKRTACKQAAAERAAFRTQQVILARALQRTWRSRTSTRLMVAKRIQLQTRRIANNAAETQAYSAVRVQAAFRGVLGRFDGEYQQLVQQRATTTQREQRRHRAALMVQAAFVVHHKKRQRRAQRVTNRMASAL
ncbi:hypothetical protein DIPPA_70063 [Diplonema papillatum]|nr:hypothetical protein DIPPA_70063 [Diplonema papillatum]